MRFAVFTVSLPEWTPEEAVERLASLGYDGVEWRVVDQRPHEGAPGFWAGNRCTWPLRTLRADAPRMRALTESARLEIPNLGTYVACDDLPAVQVAMEGAKAVGAPSVRVLAPHYDGSRPYLEVRERAVDGFRAVVDLAARLGVRALVETHMQTILPSASAAAAFCGHFDPVHVGVIHDPGNLVYEGYEPYRMGLEVLGPYLAHVHLKNASWLPVATREDGSTQWIARYAPLTAGAVDVGALFAALEAVGYQEWVSFEDFSTDEPLPERTRGNLHYARALAGYT
jgi:sugar phosphate isomerase/epimerase